jgi:ABC-type multidrug transport system fused ATPase/permease subunit
MMIVTNGHKKFPETAFEYLVKECIKPYKWAFVVSLLFVFAQTSVFNVLNWLLSQLVENIKQGATPEVLHRTLWIIGAIIFVDAINIFIPKQSIMYRQKYLYFPVEEEIYGRAISYIFGHSVNYIINKQTGTLLAKTNQINRFQVNFSLIINQFWGIISDIGVKITLLMIINVWLGVLFLLSSVLVALANYYSNKINKPTHSKYFD